MEPQLYEAVAARRLQWDALLWQVPALSMTAQAFLMTIALGPGTSQTARIITAFLSLVAAFATLQLFASNRRSELVDAHLLESSEKARDPDNVVHGEAYRDRRNAERVEDWFIRVLCHWRSYRVWMLALAIFAVVSMVTLGFAVFSPDSLSR
jgi:hypothetical protein